MVNLHIFRSISARKLLAEDNIPSEASGLGVFFHAYRDADRPFYTGIPDDMAAGNRKRPDNYRGKDYWMVKNSHRLFLTCADSISVRLDERILL